MIRVAQLPVVKLATTLALLCTPLMLVFGFMFAFDGATAKIKPPDPMWGYLLGYVWALAILFVILMTPIPQRDRKALASLWVVKVGVCLGFMLFFESNYGIDSYWYFHLGMSDPEAFANAGWGNGTANVVALSALHQAFLPGAYHALKLSFAAVGLAGVYYFYRATCLLVGRSDLRWLYALGLTPSILFWGSILGKDPIAMLGIALFTYGVIAVYRRRRARDAVVALLGLVIASWIRDWLAAIFLLPLVMFFVVGKGHFVRKALLILLSVIALGYSAQVFTERFQLDSTRALEERASTISQRWAIGGSAQRIEQRSMDLADMTAFAPVGAFTALFRPLPGEVNNAFGVLAGIENSVLLLFVALALRGGRWTKLTRPEALWIFTTIVVWAVIYGFVSYQNLGTAVRYKLQILPMMIMLVIYLLEPRRQPVPPPPVPRGAVRTAAAR